MGLLNNIEAAEQARDASEQSTRGERVRTVTVKLDIGRNVVVAVVLIGLLIGIIVLYAGDNPGPARILVDILVAVLSGALGVNAGERAGAREASRRLEN